MSFAQITCNVTPAALFLADVCDLWSLIVVCVAVVVQYEANKMYSEALRTYDVIVSGRIYVVNGKLQANMGNVYFDMGNYEKAVKYYKMSLDKVQR